MNFLVIGKKQKNLEWERLSKENNIGQFYSTDRYFTLLNEFIDKNLKRHAGFVCFIISYLMRSANFKHETSISNGKSIWVWLVDIFCWICCVAFFVCLFSGIATPIVKAIKAGDFQTAIGDALKEPDTIGLFVTALIAFSVAAAYLYMVKYVISTNKKLSLQDYVFKKIDYILKISLFLSLKKLLVKAKEEDIVIIEKSDILNDTQRWTTIQVTNLMYRLFENFNMVLKFENIDKKAKNEMQKIFDYHFKNIEIVELKQ